MTYSYHEPYGKRRKSSRRKKKKSHPLWKVFIILLLALVAGAISIFCDHQYDGEEVWVKIPKDSTSEDIKEILSEQMGSSEATRITMLWTLLRGKASNAHGAYLFSPGETSIDIARRLRTGTQTPVTVIFNNVRTIDEIAEKVGNSMELSSEEFIEACGNVLPNFGFNDSREYPAAFLPDSYELYWSISADKAVEKLLKYRNNFWNDKRRNKAKSLGLTPVQAATIASIVEEETGKADERSIIARLYINRLKKGMRLQADPTVKFAVGDFTLRRILNKHLQVESPYNTYLNDGLPPGPIRVPNASTIDAVLNAPENNYLYMCAREDFSGYHNFAVDFNSHMENARRYQAVLNNRGIK